MDTALALPLYEPPALARSLDLTHDQTEPVVWWVVFVGFAYSLALLYAYYCRRTGGDPDISFGWSGFKVSCTD